MKITLALAAIGSSVLTVLTMQPAVAISIQDPVAAFNREFPDMSPSESRAALDEIARIEEKSIDQVAREHLESHCQQGLADA